MQIYEVDLSLGEYVLDTTTHAHPNTYPHARTHERTKQNGVLIKLNKKLLCNKKNDCSPYSYESKLWY